MRLKYAAPTVLVTTTLIVGGAFVSAPAQAAGLSIPWTYTTDANPGGAAQYYAIQKKLEVCDQQADGYGAEVILINNNTNTIIKDLIESSGSGTCKTYTTSVASGTSVHFDVCLEQGGDGGYFCRVSANGQTV